MTLCDYVTDGILPLMSRKTQGILGAGVGGAYLCRPIVAGP